MMTCDHSVMLPLIIRILFPTHILALGDAAQINLDLGHGQNVGGSRHVDEELYHARVSKSSIDHAGCRAISRQRQLHPNGTARLRESGIQPTLDGALGTSGADGTEGADHEVRVELVLALAAGGDVAAKVGDLGALGLALEGARVGGRGGSAVGADGGGAEGAHGRDGGPGSRAQAEAGSGREGRHRERGGRRGGCGLKGGVVVSKGRVEVFSLVWYRLMMLCRKFWVKSAA